MHTPLKLLYWRIAIFKSLKFMTEREKNLSEEISTIVKSITF